MYQESDKVAVKLARELLVVLLYPHLLNGWLWFH